MGNKLRGKIVLVTGASRGLGAAMAEALGAAGARVAVNYRRGRDGAEKVVGRIGGAGGEALAIQADVTDERQVGGMADEIERRWGPVEILVNNATGPQPMLPFEEYSWKDFENQLDFFVKAPVLLIRRTIGAMKSARRGRIVNIGSEVVDLGNSNFSAYVTAKAAMVGMTRSLAREFGPWGITVNLVAPGWIPVERHREADPASLRAYAERVPLEHQGVPGDIANAVVFLASDEAAFITGQCLNVNGGNTF